MADSHTDTDLHAGDHVVDAHADTHEAVAAEHGGHGEHEESGPIQIELGMFLLFLVVFLAAAAVLKKFAWGPILDGLDAREEKIQKSIEQAEEIQAKLEDIESRQASMIAKADEKAKGIVEHSRDAAKEAAKVIEGKAREEAKILVENATREIDSAREKAEASLRQESAVLAVGLASKILGEELTEARQKELTDKLIKGL